MGGATYYNMPEYVAPGDDITISILLTSPVNEGIYTGYWRLKTPWNAVFGVGQYGQAFYAEIQVDRRPGQEYGILSVEYNITREPPTGCPTHVLYTVHATFTVSGPYDFTYMWAQKDGNNSDARPMSFEEAGSQTVTRSWSVARGNSPNDRWMQIIVLSPEYFEYDEAVFENNCP